MPTDFIDEELQEYRSDLLYRVKFMGCTDHLYIIVEHQSTPEKWMTIRLNKYVALIVDRYLHKKMPAVYRILIYNGEKNIRILSTLPFSKEIE